MFRFRTVNTHENTKQRFTIVNLKKINKSLDIFVNDSSQLNWDELRKINTELSDNT